MDHKRLCYTYKAGGGEGGREGEKLSRPGG